VDAGFRKRSCSIKRLERDDVSKKSHPALARDPAAEWIPVRRKIAQRV
jgi:hypothetical protein